MNDPVAVEKELQKYLSRWEKEQYIKLDNPVEYWQAYWQERVVVSSNSKHYYFEWVNDITVIAPVLRELNLNKILYVGSGISIEPLALTYAGFEVHALDISQIAIDCISKYELAEDDINKFHTTNQYREGGSIKYIAGDFTDSTICPGPYDVILTRRTLQYFTRSNFFGVIDILATKLNPGGMLINHTHNAYDVNFAIETYLTSKNFINYRLGQANIPFNNEKRIIWLFGSSG